MKSPRQITINPITITLSLLILFVAGAGGMSVVWMRTKIAQSAKRITQIQSDQKKIDIKLQDIDAKIAEAHTPEVLKAGIPSSVRPSTQEQIIWVAEDFKFTPPPVPPQELATPVPVPATPQFAVHRD
jgi:hypothetical protein